MVLHRTTSQAQGTNRCLPLAVQNPGHLTEHTHALQGNVHPQGAEPGRYGPPKRGARERTGSNGQGEGKFQSRDAGHTLAPTPPGHRPGKASRPGYAALVSQKAKTGNTQPRRLDKCRQTSNPGANTVGQAERGRPDNGRAPSRPDTKGQGGKESSKAPRRWPTAPDRGIHGTGKAPPARETFQQPFLPGTR